QRRLLPDRPPSIPGYDIAADNLPAREVGGDFFDFIPMTEDRWGFVIADVSGKGITAAIFMGLSRTIVRATMTRTLDISSSLQQANDLICRDSTSGMFVTLFYAVPIPEERKLRYVNAGHNPPLLLRKGSDEMVALRGKGIALGVKQNIRLEENVIDIGPGDTLVLYTDGVTEAVNENGEAFGEERLKHAIRESRYATAREIILRIQDAVLAFSGTLPQFDDITLLVAKVK
ncbi:MAG TPA: PP2C family protein-serine/threonine phosphatase, partial [Syntrophales bacterium]|nr:PP2C family protein-serine/threonine phosphatase [Syntrophales bacterium]